MMLLANQNSKMVIYIWSIRFHELVIPTEILKNSVTKEQKEAIEKLFEDNKWELTYQTIEGMCDLFSFQ